MKPPSGPKKQTQTKPISERPKSLAGKSGHTEIVELLRKHGPE